MKFKKGQLVVRPSEGINLYFVLDVKHPLMLVYCIESTKEQEVGQILEVQQKYFVKA